MPFERKIYNSAPSYGHNPVNKNVPYNTNGQGKKQWDVSNDSDFRIVLVKRVNDLIKHIDTLNRIVEEIEKNQIYMCEFLEKIAANSDKIAGDDEIQKTPKSQTVSKVGNGEVITETLF